MGGLFFGVQDEVVMGTRDGVIKARKLRRLNGVQEAETSIIGSCSGCQTRISGIVERRTTGGRVGGSADGCCR